MSHVIDGRIIEEHLVLCRRTATHLKPAGGIALRLHTGQQLDAAHDVVLAEQLWCRCQVLDLYHLGTRLHVLDTLTG